MATSYGRCSLGGFECIAVADGLASYPVASFFANASRSEVEAALRQNNLRTDQIATPYTCLFVAAQ